MYNSHDFNQSIPGSIALSRTSKVNSLILVSLVNIDSSLLVKVDNELYVPMCVTWYR